MWRITDEKALNRLPAGDNITAAEFRAALKGESPKPDPKSSNSRLLEMEVSPALHDSRQRVADLLAKYRCLNRACPHGAELIRFVEADDATLRFFASSLEHIEQVSFFFCLKHDWPELYYHAFAVPNGGYRKKGERFRLQAEGQKSAVPDVLIPRRIGDYVGVALEFKRVDGKASDVRKDQREALARFRDQGWYAAVAFGCEAALSILAELTGKD